MTLPLAPHTFPFPPLPRKRNEPQTLPRGIHELRILREPAHAIFISHQALPIFRSQPRPRALATPVRVMHRARTRRLLPDFSSYFGARLAMRASWRPGGRGGRSLMGWEGG